MWRDYWILSKPGIISGNLIAAGAGYCLAAQGRVEFAVLLPMLLGTALVIASGCVLNNYIDRDIDQKMRRTRYRLRMFARVGARSALVFAATAGSLGLLLLAWSTNVLALGFAALGFWVYVVLYSLVYKRSSIHGTLIGSLSGACPPIIGYVAARGQFDSGAAILLATFCFWQIPHSYAIAIYRFADYKAANIPVLPIAEGVQKARRHMIGYIIAFAAAVLMLSLFGYTGAFYALIMGAISLYWLYLAKVGYCVEAEQQRWAKRQFVFSIVAITAFSILISLDYVLTAAPPAVMFSQ